MSDLPPRAAANAPPRHQYQLIRAFEAIKNSDPALWLMISVGLREYLHPEIRHVLRCPPDFLPAGQGRAQIADDILQVMETCTELARKLREQEAAKVATTNQPRG